jgi:hypothetical protein
MAGGGILVDRGGYGSPEALSRHCGARIEVCRMVFAVVDFDPFRIADLRSQYRDADLLRQRRAVVWSAKFHTNASFSEIGKALCRDHSSITRSLDEALELWRTDPAFVDLCERISERAVLRGSWRTLGRQNAFDFPPIERPQPELPAQVAFDFGGAG